jgi:hypothetical protein
MKRKDRLAIGMIVLLGIAMIALGAVNSCATDQKLEGSLDVYLNGEKIATYSSTDLSAMKSTTFKAVIRSSSEGNSEAEFTGIPILDIAQKAVPGLSDGFKAIIVKAEDGYQTVLSKDESILKDNAYLCFLMNGAPIKGKAQKGHGPLRLIIRSDEFGQRWVKYVNRIEIKK